MGSTAGASRFSDVFENLSGNVCVGVHPDAGALPWGFAACTLAAMGFVMLHSCLLYMQHCGATLGDLLRCQTANAATLHLPSMNGHAGRSFCVVRTHRDRLCHLCRRVSKGIHTSAALTRLRPWRRSWAQRCTEIEAAEVGWTAHAPAETAGSRVLESLFDNFRSTVLCTPLCQERRLFRSLLQAVSPGQSPTQLAVLAASRYAAAPRDALTPPPRVYRKSEDFFFVLSSEWMLVQ